MPGDARNNPVKPPMVNRPMKPNAHSMGASRMMDPRYSVAVQLNTLIADGMATKKLKSEKIKPAYTEMPATNMWWPHTRKPRMAMATTANAMKLYPKMFFREKHGTISLTTPIAGSTMM